MHMLDRLAWSDFFETFLANKYTAAKRFGLEGAESLIPGMKTIIDTAADMGVTSVVIGMPHRGRVEVESNNGGGSYWYLMVTDMPRRLRSYAGLPRAGVLA